MAKLRDHRSEQKDEGTALTTKVLERYDGDGGGDGFDPPARAGIVEPAEIVGPTARGPATRREQSHRVRGASLAGLLALWFLLAHTTGSPQLLPGPGRVFVVAWQQCLNGAMPYNFGVTLARVAAAFILAMLVGGLCGYAAGRWPRADALLDPWAVVALNLPVLAVVVLLYIWVGLNDLAAVLAVAVAKAPTVFITLREGTRTLDPQLDELAVAYRLPRSRRLRRIELPQLLPYLAAAARSGLSVTWKIVLLVELLGRPNGVGFVLNLYFQDFDVAGILAYGLAFACLMLLVEAALLQPWERRANAWRRRA